MIVYKLHAFGLHIVFLFWVTMAGVVVNDSFHAHIMITFAYLKFLVEFSLLYHKRECYQGTKNTVWLQINLGSLSAGHGRYHH